MTFVVPPHQARRHLGELVEQAFYKGKPFALAWGKRPLNDKSSSILPLAVRMSTVR